MAYSLKCADSGAKCPAQFVTETKEELMDHVKMHVQKSHANMPPPPPDKVNQMIKQV